MKQRTQGAQANSTGRVAESAIDAVLRARGYIPLRQQMIGLGVYGTPIHVDFLLLECPAIERATGIPGGLIIESKWQESSGSADEKYPYLVETIRFCFPCPAIILADGDGARPGAIRWLRDQVDGNKLFAVFSLKELVTWCNRNL